MERNPKEIAKKNYMKRLKIRKFKPRFFWYRCDCCGHEYKNEYIYECAVPSLMFTWTNYYHGCENCFKSKEEFKQCLTDDKIILTEEDF